VLYDRIGGAYIETRRPDPRIARVIRAALGDAASVVNIGAGSGSYEPTDLEVVPVEPSELMIRQRPASLPPAIRGVAEALPMPDKSVDAALAFLAAHHWADRPAAFAEIRRVARRRAIFYTHDPDATFAWLDDYFPGLAGSRYPELAEFDVLGRVTIDPVPVPADCTDGFTAAYWRRPNAYLDEAVRANMSTFALLDDRVVADGVARLERDLSDSSWQSRYASLLTLSELDVGYRLVVAELG
jgi:SAM-dependent methyltransferase